MYTGSIKSGRHCLFRCAPIASGVAQRVFCRSVITQPGTTVFTRIRCCPKIPRHGARQAMHRRLGRSICRETAKRFPPAVGAQVDDRTAAGGDHARRHRLHGKKEMAQIGVHPVIPIFGGHVLPVVAVIARRVVDQHRGVSKLGLQCGKGLLQGSDVAQVADLIGGLAPQFLGKCRTRRAVHVDEADKRALLRKAPRDLGPDARCTPGDDYGLAGKAWIIRKSALHGLDNLSC